MSDTESDTQLEPIRDSHVDKAKTPETAEKSEEKPVKVQKAEEVKHEIEKEVKEEDKHAKERTESDTSRLPNGAEDSDPTSVSKTVSSSLKIKKRTLDTANVKPNTGFSRQARITNQGFSRRDNHQQSTPSSAPQAQRPQAPKPSWLRDEDIEKLQSPTPPPAPRSEEYNTQQSTDYEAERASKRLSRRPDLQAQEYQSRTHRARSEKTEREIQEEIARKTQNLDYVVRQHYNRRTYDSRLEHRDSSPIIKLKNYNNAIKYILINNATASGDRVLDLGCGKGGDINKYIMANISEYVGIDISNASITEAMKRYRHSRAPFQVTFITGDCFGQPLPAVLHHAQITTIKFPFDVISMQFCMHYAFENEQKVRTLLENITRSLKLGGLFIGTIPSSDFIREKVRQLPPDVKKFGNSVYSVTFGKQPPSDGYFEETFGNVYNYYLRDAIEDVPEYVVPFEAFRGLALEYGLKLRFKKTFTELFLQNIPVWKDKLPGGIMRHLKRTDGSIGIQGQEAEATNFYLAFEFAKVG